MWLIYPIWDARQRKATLAEHGLEQKARADLHRVGVMDGANPVYRNIYI